LNASIWYQIEAFNGLKGWLSKNYVAVGATARVTASSLNVRSGAGTSNGVVGSLKQGAAMTVDSITGNWAHITAGSLSGYVSAKYIKF